MGRGKTSSSSNSSSSKPTIRKPRTTKPTGSYTVVEQSVASRRLLETQQKALYKDPANWETSSSGLYFVIRDPNSGETVLRTHHSEVPENPPFDNPETGKPYPPKKRNTPFIDKLSGINPTKNKVTPVTTTDPSAAGKKKKAKTLVDEEETVVQPEVPTVEAPAAASASLPSSNTILSSVFPRSDSDEEYESSEFSFYDSDDKNQVSSGEEGDLNQPETSSDYTKLRGNNVAHARVHVLLSIKDLALPEAYCYHMDKGKRGKRIEHRRVCSRTECHTITSQFCEGCSDTDYGDYEPVEFLAQLTYFCPRCFSGHLAHICTKSAKPYLS